MTTPTRNGPCPCDSGVKYKKCCLPKQPVSPPRDALIVKHNGQTMLVSRGINAAHLDAAAAHFARRQRREGPAAQVLRFAEPLVAAAGNDYDRTQHALTLAMAFWNSRRDLSASTREAWSRTSAGASSAPSREPRH